MSKLEIKVQKVEIEKAVELFNLSKKAEEKIENINPKLIKIEEDPI